MGHIYNKAERLNTFTALLGALAAVFGGVWLVSLAVRTGDPWKIVSFSIYGFTLIMTYVFATLYHSSNGQAKAVFSKLDHLSIYHLITGTYCLFWGGLFYTGGLMFYLLDGKVSYFHGIWHIFVLLGSFCHFLVILYFVA